MVLKATSNTSFKRIPFPVPQHLCLSYSFVKIFLYDAIPVSMHPARLTKSDSLARARLELKGKIQFLL